MLNRVQKKRITDTIKMKWTSRRIPVITSQLETCLTCVTLARDTIDPRSFEQHFFCLVPPRDPRRVLVIVTWLVNVVASSIRIERVIITGSSGK